VFGHAETCAAGANAVNQRALVVVILHEARPAVAGQVRRGTRRLMSGALAHGAAQQFLQHGGATRCPATSSNNGPKSAMSHTYPPDDAVAGTVGATSVRRLTVEASAHAEKGAGLGR
jgi:hypothetical protein